MVTLADYGLGRLVRKVWRTLACPPFWPKVSQVYPRQPCWHRSMTRISTRTEHTLPTCRRKLLGPLLRGSRPPSRTLVSMKLLLPGFACPTAYTAVPSGLPTSPARQVRPRQNGWASRQNGCWAPRCEAVHRFSTSIHAASTNSCTNLHNVPIYLSIY